MLGEVGQTSTDLEQGQRQAKTHIGAAHEGAWPPAIGVIEGGVVVVVVGVGVGGDHGGGDNDSRDAPPPPPHTSPLKPDSGTNLVAYGGDAPSAAGVVEAGVLGGDGELEVEATVGS